MTVQRYRRKPVREVREEQCAARYNPGLPLDDIRAVARCYDDDAEVAEAAFPSGPVLVVRYYNMEGERGFRTWMMVEPGEYLACGGGLISVTEARLGEFYDLVTDGKQP